MDAAAFRSENGIQVLLSRLNFHPGKERRDVELRISLERPPEWVKIRRIDEERGNPLRVWEEMGSPQVPTPDQTRRIAEESAVLPEPLPFSYEHGQLAAHITLGDNDISFIEIGLRAQQPE